MKKRRITKPFLDTVIHHTETSSCKVTVHRKKVFTGLFFNFASFIPFVYKTNLIRTLVYRIHKISSTWVIFHEEVLKLSSFLMKNCFPKTVISKCVYDFLEKVRSPTLPLNYDVPKKECRIILPYLGNGIM